MHNFLKLRFGRCEVLTFAGSNFFWQKIKCTSIFAFNPVECIKLKITSRCKSQYFGQKTVACTSNKLWILGCSSKNTWYAACTNPVIKCWPTAYCCSSVYSAYSPSAGAAGSGTSSSLRKENRSSLFSSQRTELTSSCRGSIRTPGPSHLRPYSRKRKDKNLSKTSSRANL